MSVNETKQAVLLRVNRNPSFTVVPEHAIRMFDHVIEREEADAFKAYPDDQWGRIAFWKARILKDTLPHLRGIISVYYHEYIASLMRGDGDVEVDPYGFDNPPSYGGEARAQRDAYLACTASLA
ncbi:MAG: hypothetical protein EBZ69_00540 [Alphaproteobacteria bacterium]|nr:hypothetical protein [Alphaproteobacteria bacterium]